MRPQLGSLPCMALLTSGELVIVRAAILASQDAGRAVYLNFDELGGAFAVACNRLCQINTNRVQRFLKKSRPLGLNLIVSPPHKPLAIRMTLSLGEVSPSTEIILKDLSTDSFKDSSRNPSSTGASVVRKRKHGRHIGVYHAGALGDTADDETRGCDGALLRYGIGGHDSLRHVMPAVSWTKQSG